MKTSEPRTSLSKEKKKWRKTRTKRRVSFTNAIQALPALRKQHSGKTQHTITHVNNRTLELIRTIRAYKWMGVFKNGSEPLQSFIVVVSQQSSTRAVDVMARSCVWWLTTKTRKKNHVRVTRFTCFVVARTIRSRSTRWFCWLIAHYNINNKCISNAPNPSMTVHVCEAQGALHETLQYTP